MSDTKLFRKSFEEAGFRADPSFPGIVFNDKTRAGDIRRLKLWHGDGVFGACALAQEALEARFKANFGDRYMFGQFIEAHPRIADKSFVIYVFTA